MVEASNHGRAAPGRDGAVATASVGAANGTMTAGRGAHARERRAVAALMVWASGTVMAAGAGNARERRGGRRRMVGGQRQGDGEEGGPRPAEAAAGSCLVVGRGGQPLFLVGRVGSAWERRAVSAETEFEGWVHVVSRCGRRPG